MIGLGFDKNVLNLLNIWKGNYVCCCWSIFRRPICHRSGLCCWKTVIHQVFSKLELPPLAPPSLHCILLLGHTWYLSWPAVVYFFSRCGVLFGQIWFFVSKFLIFGVLFTGLNSVWWCKKIDKYQACCRVEKDPKIKSYVHDFYCCISAHKERRVLNFSKHASSKNVFVSLIEFSSQPGALWAPLASSSICPNRNCRHIHILI